MGIIAQLNPAFSNFQKNLPDKTPDKIRCLGVVTFWKRLA
ncbi:hypothetical protein MICAG_4200002 [Microcystis aeruginosa PCC 9808]|uniref:Uncharacterized protein n=1 Tax=Microcystis aeruginosa PCC 9808 TaxID=1160284 RepID=I4I1H3_MICAE|nr:hypothetical protein MICAG_4200002 [Microcystis aeruginosa PCC 9808]